MKSLLILISLFVSHKAFCNYITLVSSIHVVKEDVGYKIKGYVHNRGNDTAKDITLTSSKINFEYRLFTQLLPSEKKSFEFLANEREGLQNISGSYVLSFLLGYKDLNNYQFSSPLLYAFNTGQYQFVAPVKIKPIKEFIQIDKSKYFEIELKNKSNRVLMLNLRTIASRELVFKAPTKISLKADEDFKLPVEVINISGRLNSSYFIFLVAETIENNQLYSSFGTFSVRIGVNKKTEESQNKGFSVFFLLVLLIGATFFLEKKGLIE